MKSWMTRLSGLAICGATILATAQASAQTTWYVDDANCPGPGMGTEADPFCKIQDGIDAAQDGETVLAADGVYAGDGNRDLDFNGKLITVRSASGDPSLCIIDCEGKEGDPHRGFFFHSGETADAVVEGLTIRDGRIGGYLEYEAFGGGIRIEASSPTIINCRIVENTALSHFEAHGGGIYSGGGGSPTIIACIISGNAALGADKPGFGGGIDFAGGSPTVLNCTISNNSASSGDGLYCVGGSPTITGCTITGNQGSGLSFSASSPMIANCTISANTGSGMGNGGSSPTITNCTFSQNARGMYNFDSSPTLTNCAFIGNSTAFDGGGMYNTSNSSPVLIDCQFVANSAAGIGGAMVNSGNSSSPTLINCTFEGNVANTNGGAIHNNVSSPILAGCVFRENIAALGSSIFNLNSFGVSIIANCKFDGNDSLESGGIYNDNSSPRITNCTFTDNTAGLQGAGIFNIFNSSPTVTNCSFSGNSAAVDGGAMYTSGESSMPIFANSIVWSDTASGIVDADGAVTTVSYSNNQGGWSGAGSNNIDADPLFLDPDSGDLHLSPGSPCIDAGNNKAVAADSTDLDADGDEDEPTPVDLDGNPRFVDDPDSHDSGLGSCPLSDMGAYEFQAALTQCCPADFNQDGGVGPLDLATLLSNWGPCPGCPEDLNGDGNVGPADLAFLLAAWGPCQ